MRTDSGLFVVFYVIEDDNKTVAKYNCCKQNVSAKIKQLSKYILKCVVESERQVNVWLE